MLTIHNLRKILLNEVIEVPIPINMNLSTYWKITGIYETELNYQIQLIEKLDKHICTFSLLRNKDNENDRYILYTLQTGKPAKHIHLTNETLQSPKAFLFQLECCLYNCMFPLNPPNA